MNTNILKKFAQETRKKLIAQIGAKLEYVLNSDSIVLREKETQINRLKEEIAKSSKSLVIDKVAYTWFNRLMALRFMDVNDFQPLGIRIISPKEGFTTPEILDEAKRGNIPADLTVKKDRIFDLLDGKIPSANPQNEVFKDLLIAACNHLHKTLPFLFERINDYTDLLLPDDMTSDFSIVQDIRNGMSAEDCKEVEIIGWLYQFYISEKKDEVFASKAAVKKEDIPAATQLFTPRWIVEYMVQNTVGKLWIQNRPNSKLREVMPYFIDSPSVSPSGEMSSGQRGDDFLKINSVEEIKLLDQACGSGHILVYGFDLFYKMYEEEGYNSNEIPKLILENNLFGFEIDERAAQLASMALIMKARSYNKRLFRESVSPNISCYEDLRISSAEIQDTFRQVGVQASEALLHDLKTMGQATNLGSLIYPSSALSELKTVRDKLESKSETSDAFLSYQVQQVQTAIHQLIQLGEKYHCVVDNPPYMGGAKMNKELGDWVKINYPKSKADLMVCFMEQAMKQVHDNGFVGMINLPSWMFLSSFEDFRKTLIKDHLIDTMLHLGRGIFGSDFGSVAFTLINKKAKSVKGIYRRLFKEHVKVRSVEKIQKLFLDRKYGHFSIEQKDFQKIPGSPIGYWLSEKQLEVFLMPSMKSVGEAKQGLATTDNNRFCRNWSEIDHNRFDKLDKSDNQSYKWFPLSKGGSNRKWYGNISTLLNYENDGREIKENVLRKYTYLKTPDFVVKNQEYYFKESIGWGDITSSGISFRYYPPGTIITDVGMGYFLNDGENTLNFLGAVNSKFYSMLSDLLNPTIHFKGGNFNDFPIPKCFGETYNTIVNSCVKISKNEWFSRETDWNFTSNELIKQEVQDLEQAFDFYKEYWKNKFFQLHKNEEELNRQFIEIYELQDELNPEVPLEEITILQDELDREDLRTQNTRLERDPMTGLVNDYSDLKLTFDAKEVFSQFISYAVGCMFGRFSMVKEGLILANQGETLEDYLKIIDSESNQSPAFLPDRDNIIPVLDDEWFEDDIVARFKEFFTVTFGKENLEKNLAFVESCIGKDIRKYFVKDFYTDHIQRYKKRPIYWMFSSPKGSFNVLIYMHRYTPDTLGKILNDYLNQYREKLKGRVQHLDHLIVSGSSTEQTKAAKEKDRIRGILLELQEYERDILYPLATERITIDLDEGVLVNYNKFGQAIKEVAGLNDKKTKQKVREFDWIDTSTIR